MLQAIWRLDYAGIVILIVASFVPAVHYGFLCEVSLRTLYMSVTLTLGKPQHSMHACLPGMAVEAFSASLVLQQSLMRSLLLVCLRRVMSLQADQLNRPSVQGWQRCA